jgi:Na+-driven multidrug efflux pump
MGLEGIWIALCGEFTIRAGLFTLRFLHGGWRKIAV